jgi:hypothetical protein
MGCSNLSYHRIHGVNNKARHSIVSTDIIRPFVCVTVVSIAGVCCEVGCRCHCPISEVAIYTDEEGQEEEEEEDD